MAKETDSKPRVTLQNRFKRPKGNHTYQGITRTAATLFEMNRRHQLATRWGVNAGPSATTRMSDREYG